MDFLFRIYVCFGLLFFLCFLTVLLPCGIYIFWTLVYFHLFNEMFRFLLKNILINFIYFFILYSQMVVIILPFIFLYSNLQKIQTSTVYFLHSQMLICRVLHPEIHHKVYFVAEHWIFDRSVPLDMTWTTHWCIIMSW